MISTIIHKEFLETTKIVNIAWTQGAGSVFTDFIKECCSPCNLIEFDQTYYGMYDINLIVCNDRSKYLEKCVSLAQFLHCPILIVDHEQKLDSTNIFNLDNTNIQPIYSVATSDDIYVSWNKIQNNVLSYDMFDATNHKIWNNLILQLAKTTIKIKEDESDT